MGADPSLLEVLGGETGCKRLAHDFYTRVGANAELKPLFPGKSLRCATEEFAAFLIQFLGGDEKETQYRWWLSLRESHARFRISEAQRAAWLQNMEETLDALVTDIETRLAIARLFHIASAYIVGKNEGEPDHEDLSTRWNQQLALDKVIKDIVCANDTEAIARARQFTSRRAVFIGILARMIEAGREPLVEFVLQSIQSDPQLAYAWFNRRSLLHFAASFSSLPVVQQLLEMGVDPNTVDGDGHSALYRVAGRHKGETGSQIVFALVKAGATVDQCKGVNKSTPLHDAARHGNLEVARALLDAGASPLARDKNGLTPLDRARRCRRNEVASLIASRLSTRIEPGL